MLNRTEEIQAKVQLEVCWDYNTQWKVFNMNLKEVRFRASVI